jgi:xanthine/uracil/vitamin C permease (AzgA family)
MIMTEKLREECLKAVTVKRVNSVSGLLHMRVETSVLVSGVVYGAGGAIRFYQLVVAFNFIAVTFLSLLFDVVSVWILHSILELVLGMGLLERKIPMLK